MEYKYNSTVFFRGGWVGLVGKLAWSPVENNGDKEAGVNMMRKLAVRILSHCHMKNAVFFPL